MYLQILVISAITIQPSGMADTETSLERGDQCLKRGDQ
jgi:hypothetical protein